LRHNPLPRKNAFVLNASPHWTARHKNGENANLPLAPYKRRIGWRWVAKPKLYWDIPSPGLRGKYGKIEIPNNAQDAVYWCPAYSWVFDYNIPATKF